MMTLLPAKAGTCSMCAVDHAPDEAHNAMSMFYQMRFWMNHGRWPTWADAIAHLDDAQRQLWKQALKKHGHWTEPDAGIEPIAEKGDSHA